jgi:hypothetical protein
MFAGGVCARDCAPCARAMFQRDVSTGFAARFAARFYAKVLLGAHRDRDIM